jgi:predicted RNase H-like nuclease (RuvC/YqgF family)
VECLRSKTEFTGLLSPTSNKNSPPIRPSKSEIEEAVHQYLAANLFSKKLQALESQVLETKALPDMVSILSKQIVKIHKESDTQNLMQECKALQEYIKREILMVNNRINGLEATLKEERRRPSTATTSKPTLTTNDSKLTCSVSYKKLTPAPSCISCYSTSLLVSSFGNRKNAIQK